MVGVGVVQGYTRVCIRMWGCTCMHMDEWSICWGDLCCEGSVALGVQESCSCIRAAYWALSATEEICTHWNIFLLLIICPGNTVEIS